MKFKVKQTVEYVSFEGLEIKNVGPYLRRACGLELYFREIHDLTEHVTQNMKEKVFKAYRYAIIGATNALAPLILAYYKVLYMEMGFTDEEASLKTWEMFIKKIEDFAETYHELFEIEHYLYMAENMKLVVVK